MVGWMTDRPPLTGRKWEFASIGAGERASESICSPAISFERLAHTRLTNSPSSPSTTVEFIPLNDRKSLASPLLLSYLSNTLRSTPLEGNEGNFWFLVGNSPKHRSSSSTSKSPHSVFLRRVASRPSAAETQRRLTRMECNARALPSVWRGGPDRGRADDSCSLHK